MALCGDRRCRTLEIVSNSNSNVMRDVRLMRLRCYEWSKEKGERTTKNPHHQLERGWHLDSVHSPAVLLVAVGHVDAARADHERLVNHGQGQRREAK